MNLKKIFSLLVAVAVLLTVNASTCNAEAIYNILDYVPKIGYRTYGAFVKDDSFLHSGRNISIRIEKDNVIAVNSPRDFYHYVIEISQRTDQKPFDLKSVIIMSEVDSIKIDVTKPNRNTGLDTVTDRIDYFKDPGKVNRVIKSVRAKMLIRITTTDDEEYDFYPSRRYINYAKRVADWY